MATANMGLILPIPGVTQALGIAPPGESWMELQNAAALTIDAHNHTAGMGAPLPSAALNIDADVNWNGYNLIGLRSARFAPQASPIGFAEDIGALYVYANELWYRDIAGVSVQITADGSVVGPPGSITGMAPPATAVYAAGTFTWKSDVAAYAGMVNGSVTIHDQVGAGNHVQILASPSAPASFNLTLPNALPGVTTILTLGAGGALAASYTLDESTITGAGGVIGVPALGIGTAQIADLGVTTAKIDSLAVTTGKIADLNVTAAKIADLNVTTSKIADLAVTRQKMAALSQDTADVTSWVLSNTPVTTDIPFVAGTLTLTGVTRPVLVMLQAQTGYTMSISYNGASYATFSLLRKQNAGSWVLAQSWTTGPTGSYGSTFMPAFFDDPTFGGGTTPATIEWKLQVTMGDSASTVIVTRVQMVAYPL